jgi:hypothetical protein
MDAPPPCGKKLHDPRYDIMATTLKNRPFARAFALLVAACSVAACADASDGEFDAMAGGEEDVAEVEQHMGIRADPDLLCITTGSNSNAGTTATVTLTWIDDYETWRCSVNPTASNTEYCCNATYQGFSAATGYFGINNPSGDGMQLDEAYAIDLYCSNNLCEDWLYHADLFTDVFGKYCNGYSLGDLAYDRCWVDDDGHGNCGHMKLGAEAEAWSAVSFSCQ